MVRTVKTFQNARTRIYRLGNGECHPGWVVNLAPDAARVRLHRFAPFGADETVVGECYGDGSAVRFAGRMVAQVGQEIAMEIVGPTVFYPSLETMRLCVDNLDGMLNEDGQQVGLSILDVSRRSLGGIADRAFKVGTELGVSLKTPAGRYEANVSIANCRVIDAESGHFRVGLKIVRTSRLDGAMWHRFVEERAGM